MNRLPLSLVKEGIKLRELLQSNRMNCIPPPGGSSEPSTESQTIHSQGQPPACHAATTQLSEKYTNEDDSLSVTEIKILKAKLVKDNNLDELLELENKNESSLENTIETRLEKNNLVQESPEERINLSHLHQATQQDLNELINDYKEAFSENKFDIGLFTGFPGGITLDVQEGATAF